MPSYQLAGNRCCSAAWCTNCDERLEVSCPGCRAPLNKAPPVVSRSNVVCVEKVEVKVHDSMVDLSDPDNTIHDEQLHQIEQYKAWFKINDSETFYYEADDFAEGYIDYRYFHTNLSSWLNEHLLGSFNNDNAIDASVDLVIAGHYEEALEARWAGKELEEHTNM